MDREGKDAFDLMDEVEQSWDCYPLSFPIGMGYDFQIYNLWEQNINYLVETIVKHRRNNCFLDVQNLN
jgi:peptide chain release factor 3